MPRPTVEELTIKLLDFINDGQKGIKLESYDANWRKSGVYAVLDCVFSSQLRYTGVEKALAYFSEKSSLRDDADLSFSDFLRFVRGNQHQRPSAERFQEVASKYFGNRGKISGRTKVEVAYDVCEFFAVQGYETRADLQALPGGTPFTCQHPGEPGELEKLVMNRVVNGAAGEGKVRGMGVALGAYLLMCLGRTDFVKPDTLLLRLVGRVNGSDWRPASGDAADYLLVRQAISCVAERLGHSAAGVDNALWRYESSNAKKSISSSSQ